MRPSRVAALAGALAAALALPAAGPGRFITADPSGAELVSRGDGLILQTPAYQVVLAKQNGALLEIIDRISGTRLAKGQDGCQWGAKATPDNGYVGGCAFGPGKPDRFSYRWNQGTGTLTLTYLGDATSAKYTNAVVTLTARETYLDLRLALENHRRQTLVTVNFPSDIFVDSRAVRAGYAPNFLPGVRFERSFFSRVGNNVQRYPSRWAFADFLSLDVGRSNLALYSVNPPPSPLAPVDLGFLRKGSPAPCSDPLFCLTHVFFTWIRDGQSWRSPLVRIRLGQPVRQAIMAYRHDNGIDDDPSLREKLGAKLDTLVQAPLIKADPTQGLPPFALWGKDLGRLPSPALLHPVAFQAGGFDENDPDALPPDPRWGTNQDFRAAIEAAHSVDQLVMPYLNVSWWDGGSPTMLGLPPPLTPRDVAALDSLGRPVVENYGNHSGYIVSPYAPVVRNRVSRVFEEWKVDVPADCLFFDQIGARVWRYDFNPAEPTPLAYDDGWLSLLAPYAGRCVMVEDGWDRLAASSSGFHGGLLLMQRQFREPDVKWGPGNWDPYPLAEWLFGDKVLLYQHDLYEGTMTTDPEALTWNLAFGFVLSYDWNGDAGTISSPWLDVVGRVQRELGPHYAGKQLTDFRQLAPDVTESGFGPYSVVANWSRTRPYDVAGRRIAPLGFLARTDDGDILAGTFGDAWSGVTFVGPTR